MKIQDIRAALDWHWAASASGDQLRYHQYHVASERGENLMAF